MQALKKITIEVPEPLISHAQKITGEGITETVKKGLELVTTSFIYKKVKSLRGKVKFSLDWETMKHDRT